MSSSHSASFRQPSTPPLQVSASRDFPDWLAQHGVSLAFTTYQTARLFLVGRKTEQRLSIFERTFPRAMGLWTDGQTMWLAAAYQLWRLENVLAAGDIDDGFDRLYVPRIGYTTGDIDVHDVAVNGEGNVVFVSSLFGCLATVSDRRNFAPLWQPPFLSKLAAEDRCHLNGLAMEDDEPRYVSVCARSDVADGWRAHRHEGGCVVDVNTGDIVADGLSMPHSPRIYRGRLWILDSGNGFFGYIDGKTGRFEPVSFCPGYARGLAFHGDYAVVGLSRPRNDPTFQGLQLDAELDAHGAKPRSGLHVIDLNTGGVAHWLRVEGVVEELYDVVILPNVTRPKALGFKTDEIRHSVWFEENGRSTKWTARKPK